MNRLFIDRFIYVVGIGDDGPSGLSRDMLARVKAASLLYGGQRHLSFFDDVATDKRVIQSPIKDFLTDIGTAHHEVNGDIVVLASGDPLFYGIASTLIKHFGQASVKVVPTVSSIQLAFARAGESWQTAKVVSLHGQPVRGLAQKLHGVPLAALFTDEHNSPQAIARYLLSFGMTEFKLFVAEQLGNDSERTGWYSLEEAIDKSFHPLNVVIVKHRQDATVPVFTLGMDDGRFTKRKPDRGLITKREVRVQTLAELALKPGQVMWDIGACTGSVSIEATLSIPELRVFAVEKNEGDLENLLDNQRKFRTDFVAVHAKAPEGLDPFPNPDAVFIGGSGGELGELLRLCADRLNEGGRIVVNAATIENLYLAQQTLQQNGFTVSVTLIQTARSKPILQLTRFEGMNPVYLVTAWRTPLEAENLITTEVEKG
jgi:precorrin-6B C5,15-methyltransferase / cobalt-precorrin-6B C5,C15-methyltransferase